MPPMPPVPGVVKVLFGGFVDNTQVQNWANVLHFAWTGAAPTVANLTAFADQVVSAWVVNMAPECPAPTTLQTCQVTDLSSASSAQVRVDAAHTGTRGDDSGPANAAVLISYPVSLRWKGGHPRSYLYVGGVDDYQGAAEWSNLFQAEVLAHWKLFVQSLINYNLGATTITNLVCVKTHGKFAPNQGPPAYVLDTPVVVPLDITTSRASLEIASQRARIGRAARNRAGALP